VALRPLPVTGNRLETAPIGRHWRCQCGHGTVSAITGTWTLSVILKDPRWASALVRLKARALPVSNLRLSGAVASGGDRVLCQQGLGYIPAPMVRRLGWMPIRLLAHRARCSLRLPVADCRPNVAGY
jgi:hypothetical protein